MSLRRQDGVETLEVALVGVLFFLVLLIGAPVLFDGVDVALEAVGTAIQKAGDQMPDSG